MYVENLNWDMKTNKEVLSINLLKIDLIYTLIYKAQQHVDKKYIREYIFVCSNVLNFDFNDINRININDNYLYVYMFHKNNFQNT